MKTHTLSFLFKLDFLGSRDEILLAEAVVSKHLGRICGEILRLCESKRKWERVEE